MASNSSKLIVSSTLKVGCVYKFEAEEYIDTSVPHYFIVVAIEDEDNFLVLCTSQRRKAEHHFKKRGFSLSELVYIKPEKNNCFTTDTYVNCHQYYKIEREVLEQKVQFNILEHKGNISYNHYDQIRQGIISSYVNDIPAYLLVHPED